MTEIEPVTDAELDGLHFALTAGSPFGMDYDPAVVMLSPLVSLDAIRARTRRDAEEITELRRVKDGMATEMVEASDHLASVLGYPLDPDENGVPTGPHYCVGDHTIATLAAEAAQVIAAIKARQAWRPMSEAPKDGTSVLLLTKRPIPREDRPDLDIWAGLQFVGRHPGLADDGLDIGWSFAAPVGNGGFPDDWFVGWQPLPTPPEDSAHG